MKQVIKCLGFAFFCSILALILKTPSIHAFASVDFGTRVEVIDSIPPGSDPALEIGDIKVTVTVENNSGFMAGGMSSSFSTQVFTLVYKNNGKILGGNCEIGSAHNGYVTDHPEIGRVSIGFLGYEEDDSTGDLFCYYLRPISSTFDYMDIGTSLYGLDVNELKGEHGVSVPYVEPTTFEYTLPISYTVSSSYTFMLGDVNGDGYITVEDVQLLVQLYHISQTEELDVDGTYTVSSTTYPGLYISINGTPTLVLRVADVNRDCVINEDDAWDLLAYYTEVVVSGQPYDGEIGQMQTHIKYIIQFS